MVDLEVGFISAFSTKIKACWMAVSAVYNWPCHMKMKTAHPIVTNWTSAAVVPLPNVAQTCASP